MQTNDQLNQAGGQNPLDAALLQAFSDSFTMYYRAHAFHWNVKGPEFSQFHDFFATIYEDVYGSIDSLAENIRKIACDAPLALNDICGMSRVNVSDVTSSNPMDMTASLRDANEVVMTSLNVAFSVAVAVNEQGIADFIASRLDAHKKWAWQLSTTLGADDKPKIETSSVAHVERVMPIEVQVQPADDMDVDMNEPRMMHFSDVTESTLSSKVDEHNDVAPNGRKASLEMLKAVYRRGAGSFSNSNRQDLSRDDWAMSRVNSYLRLLRTGAPVSLSYTQDNDLLPSGHPKSIKEATMTASAVIASELSLTIKEEYEYSSPEHAIVSFAEFSGLGYESIPVFRAAWKRAVVENENPFNRAKDLAVKMYSSKDADLLPKKK
jgi:starvation-inducible DNA-binding protein